MLNTVKKSQSNNFINNSTSTSNLFAQRFPAKKEIAPFNNSQSQIPSNLQKIVSSLVYSCCNENIIRVTPSGKILPPHPVYAMPCGHNMCHKCITTILEKIPNPMISCSNNDCTQRYSPNEAENLFVKNHLITSFAQKLRKFQCEQEITAKHMQKVNQGVRFGQTKPKRMQNNDQNMKNGYPMQVDIDKKESDSEESSEKQFHICTNVFCRRPTTEFFCSDNCQKLQDDLDGDFWEEPDSQNRVNLNQITF